MSDSVDRVFVHALNTVKRIPRMGSARPPPEDRLKLYGLYKQSTEGDVDGVMDRPVGESEELRADQQKWDSWNSQKGVSRTEAKRRYITTLVQTMHRYASNTPDARELVSELEFVWDQIKSNSPSSASSNSYALHRQHSSTSPSNTDQPIYPVMSEQGSRNPRAHGNPQHLRVMSPVSQSQRADGVREEQELDGDALDDGEDERFVDAQDSQIADNDVFSTSDAQLRGHEKGTSAVIVSAGPGSNKKTPKSSEIPNSRWHRRIENALIKMNAEMAALREQLEMQQNTSVYSSILPSFGRPGKPRGFLRLFLDSATSITLTLTRHLIVDAAVIALITFFMHYQGIPMEKLEQLILAYLRKIQFVALDNLNSVKQAFVFVRYPIYLPRALAFSPRRTRRG